MAQSLETEKYIGMSLALASGVLIGTSFIITKMGLMEAHASGAAPGENFNYLNSPMWWAGTSTMVLGETANVMCK